MSVFDILTLLGGLAMFLYGMRLMGDGLKEGSSGTLKSIMEKVTNNPFKAFLLGLAVTAIIQSSTATIVITSGLVGAGIISLHQSLGIIIGANVGTTVTGQIIRLLDISSDASAWLQVFKPSTLAPIALIIGIICLIGFSFKNSKTVGTIAIGFGILFTGLLTMTGAVDVLSSTGIFETMFSKLGENPFLGYVTGAGVAFVLQSSSATIGILQAFSASGQLIFKSIYAVIVGIYLGDCITTSIVCSIGARAEARRVGIVNILFNLSETVVVLVAMTIIKYFGLLDRIWEMPVNAGIIANTNTIFNLSCAILLFPLLGVYEKLARRIVKDDTEEVNPFAEKMEALSPAFFSTPAIALNGCYTLMMEMFLSVKESISKALGLVQHFDYTGYDEIVRKEAYIDQITDNVSHYLHDLSPHVTTEANFVILDQYYKVVTQFERLGDGAEDIANLAKSLHESGEPFSEVALKELEVLEDLTYRILEFTEVAFEKRSEKAAREIEPLEEVVDDLTNALRDNHLTRMKTGFCTVEHGTYYMNLLMLVEHISDICSNIGVATLTRIHPELAAQAHDYISTLHAGDDEDYNRIYRQAHASYFAKLHKPEQPALVHTGEAETEGL